MTVEGREEWRCAVLALTKGGDALGRRLAASLDGDFIACKGRLAAVFAEVWRDYLQIVCIMATGGHPVLTTASDVLGHTALDLWCRDLGLIPGDKAAFTRAMGRLVDHGSLKVWSACPLPPLPPDLHPVDDRDAADLIVDARTESAARGAFLRPRALVFGIGCNRGTPAAAIARAVAATCAQHRLAPEAIARLASIDLKQDEAGLLEFARDQGLAIDFFSSNQLNQVAGVSTSPAVLKATGAKGVAEPAALLSAGPGSTLLVDKMKWTDVTTAVAEIADPLVITTKGTLTA